MKQLPFSRVPCRALFALCLVALQLLMALHFALVPHGSSAGLGGFEHVRLNAVRSPLDQERAQAELARKASSQSSEFESGVSACAGDACPIGFAGQPSVLLAADVASAWLSFPRVAASVAPSVPEAPRSPVSLSARKTSPPVRLASIFANSQTI
jgi:hypothetical protein